jgi:hypothetical protein
MAKKNHRPLGTITAEIHRLHRQNVFALGKLLIEAKAQQDHGKWLRYLKDIDWSPRSAQLYMSVAELAAKNEAVAHLEAAPTALYNLVWIAERHKDVLDVAIERLVKSVARKDTAKLQCQVVRNSPAAANHPNANEFALQAALETVNQNCFGDSGRYEAMMEQGRAIVVANPTTQKELDAIRAKHPVPSIVDLSQDPEATVVEFEDDDQSPSAPDEFVTAVQFLRTLCARPAGTFLGLMDAGDLDMVGNFLKQIAAASAKPA